jgi:sigma-B regulation protein RsbU (phosphoserine phosphatase)
MPSDTTASTTGTSRSTRSQALPQTDFHDPGSVLAALNKAFPMERQNDMFFTIWYGVFDRAARRLRWAGGGHPPALLLTGDDGPPSRLDSDGPLIGAVDGLEFESRELAVPAGSRLFVYSDGAFEVSRPDGSMWAFDEFVRAMSAAPDGAENRMDRLVTQIRQLSGREDFSDDFSMVEIVFG